MEEIVKNQNAPETDVDSSREKKENIVAFDFKMIAFSLAGKDYAIDIMNVKEIAKGGRYTYVPNTAPFVLGVYNLRGEIIPIIDLRLFFNISIAPQTTNEIENMIIVTVEDKVFGIVVDAIDKVVGIHKSTIQPPHPLFGDINIKFIYGIVESNNRLYVLLDVDRIFSDRIRDEDVGSGINSVNVSEVSVQPRFSGKSINEVLKQSLEASESHKVASQTPSTEEKPAAKEEKTDSSQNIDLEFIIEGLVNFKKFYTTEINKKWVKKRFAEWVEERGADNTQLTNEEDAEKYLEGFMSKHTDQFWSDEYAEAIFSLLPDNPAKQIVVWNPGCGKGYESYSLACLFKKRYPEARIRVFAQDLDLLNVSNASLLLVPDDVANSWYGPYLTKTVSGGFSFCQDIKDIVMFEYHDVSHTNTVPAADVIFCRDMLSFASEEAQNTVLSDFEEKLKGNGLLILGDNESLSTRLNWSEKTDGDICIYTK